MNYVLYSDGGARGNPGPAGCGFVIKDEKGKNLHEGSKYIGETTNNQAEYQALILALEKLKQMDKEIDSVECYLDSELIVKQLNKEYKVKNAELRPLFDKVAVLCFELGGRVKFSHVRREKNKEADRLANQAMDSATL